MAADQPEEAPSDESSYDYTPPIGRSGKPEPTQPPDYTWAPPTRRDEQPAPDAQPEPEPQPQPEPVLIVPDAPPQPGEWSYVYTPPTPPPQPVIVVPQEPPAPEPIGRGGAPEPTPPPDYTWTPPDRRDQVAPAPEPQPEPVIVVPQEPPAPEPIGRSGAPEPTPPPDYTWTPPDRRDQVAPAPEPQPVIVVPQEPTPAPEPIGRSGAPEPTLPPAYTWTPPERRDQVAPIPEPQPEPVIVIPQEPPAPEPTPFEARGGRTTILIPTQDQETTQPIGRSGATRRDLPADFEWTPPDHREAVASTAATPPATGTSPTSSTTSTPTAGTGLISNPTGIDAYGNTVYYNSMWYGTKDAADKLAAATGGKVVDENAYTKISGNQPMYGVVLPNGAEVNVGAIQSIINNPAYGGNWRVIDGEIEKLLNNSTCLTAQGNPISGCTASRNGYYAVENGVITFHPDIWVPGTTNNLASNNWGDQFGTPGAVDRIAQMIGGNTPSPVPTPTKTTSTTPATSTSTGAKTASSTASTSTSTSTATTPTTAIVVPVAYSPRIVLANLTSGNPALIVAGRDLWRLTISGGRPNTAVTVTATKNGGSPSTSTYGQTDSQGYWTLSGYSNIADAGAWVQSWRVGTDDAGTLSFAIQQAPAVDTTPSILVPAVYRPQLTFTNLTTGNPAVIVAGVDQWRITISNARPNAAVTVTAQRQGSEASTSPMGTTDANGYWSLTGSSDSADVGTWGLAWKAGDDVAGTMAFQIVRTAAATTTTTTAKSPVERIQAAITSTAKTAAQKVDDAAAAAGIPSAVIWAGVLGAAALMVLPGTKRKRT